MGDPVRCLPKVVHPDVAALKLQHNPRGRGEGVLPLSPRAIRVRRHQRGQGVEVRLKHAAPSLSLDARRHLARVAPPLFQSPHPRPAHAVLRRHIGRLHPGIAVEERPLSQIHRIGTHRSSCIGAPHRPPPADRHPGPPRVAAHRPRARRPPRLARTFAPPSRVTGLRETAHGGAVPQAARNGPSAQSFDQRGLHSTAATSDPSFAIRSHRPGNRNRTLYE